MFSGLRSRWTIPREWRWATPSQTSRKELRGLGWERNLRLFWLRKALKVFGCNCGWWHHSDDFDGFWSDKEGIERQTWRMKPRHWKWKEINTTDKKFASSKPRHIYIVILCIPDPQWGGTPHLQLNQTVLLLSDKHHYNINSKRIIICWQIPKETQEGNLINVSAILR